MPSASADPFDRATSSTSPAVPSPPRARWWLLLAAVLIAFRALPYVVWGTLSFDADQAVVGLMAKHVSELRALPVYQYALSYVLMVSAYVAAPFMWVAGPTIASLKFPLLLANVAVGLLLIVAMLRSGVRPRHAFVLALPVLVPAPVTSAGLMDALGMTVEPALFVLGLWLTRRSPLVFGILAAVGFHVREFVAYGVAAVIAVDVLDGGACARERRRDWMRAGLSALGTSALLAGIARFASIRGPDTWVSEADAGNLATLGGAFCFAADQAAANVLDLGRSYLGLLWGPARAPLADAAVHSGLWQGAPWAWPAFAALMLAAACHAAAHWRRVWRARHEPSVQLALVLILVGTQAVVVYAVSRCGPLSVMTMRYALLGLFLPTGVFLLAWATGPSAWLSRAITAGLIGLAALNAWPHARLWVEQWRTPSVSNRALLGPAMEARGLRYARSDYWTAYYVAFITRERVVVGSDTLSRVDVYERELARHADEVVRISTTPCGPTPAIVPGYYVCREAVP